MTLDTAATGRWGGLPLTVEELVANYIRTQRANEELCTFIDMIRVECNGLAESSPCAAQALRDIFPTTSHEKDAPGSQLKRNNICGDYNSKFHEDSVLGDEIVMGAKLSRGQQTTLGETAKSRFLRFVEEAKRDYKEECNVLRLKLLAMKGGEELLAQTRKKLLEQEEDCQACISALNACREELAVSRSQCSLLLSALNDNVTTVNDQVTSRPLEQFSDCIPVDNNTSSGSCVPIAIVPSEGVSVRCVKLRLVETEVKLQESQAVIKALEANIKELSYDKDQLNARLEALMTERDEVMMCNERLEGQVQRLSSTLQESSEMLPQRQENSHGNVASLQQVKMAAEEVEMKKRLYQLQCENHSLQNVLLQLQRQINDSELRAEESFSGNDEVVIQLKEEVARLRGALSEKEFLVQQTSHEWKRAAEEWRLLDRVHTTVVHHMSMQILRGATTKFLAETCETTNFTMSLTSGGTKAMASTAEVTEVGETATSSQLCHSADGDCVKEPFVFSDPKESKQHLTIKHLRQVNQELRCALATSEGELKQKELHIEVLKKQAQGNCACNVTAHPPHETTNSSSGQQNMDKRFLATQNDLEQMYALRLRELEEEKKVLTQRVEELQECKESLGALLEDYQKRCAALEREVASNAETMNILVVSGAISPAALHARKSGTTSTDMVQVRSLQCMLRDTLEKNMVLSAKLSELENRRRKTETNKQARSVMASSSIKAMMSKAVTTSPTFFSDMNAVQGYKDRKDAIRKERKERASTLSQWYGMRKADLGAAEKQEIELLQFRNFINPELKHQAPKNNSGTSDFVEFGFFAGTGKNKRRRLKSFADEWVTENPELEEIVTRRLKRNVRLNRKTKQIMAKKAEKAAARAKAKKTSKRSSRRITL